jgi:hypothetical protein
MNLPPLVERELRAAARQPGMFWLRALIALVAVLKCVELLDRFVIALPSPGRMALTGAPMAPVTGADFLHELAWLLFLGALLLGLQGTEALSRERREGTLGLLLITGLRSREVVYSKALSCGLMSFVALLSFVPAILVSVLAGGISGFQALLTAFGLLNTLFVSLASGLWMAAVFRQRRMAVMATLGLVGALAFGGDLLGAGLLGRAGAPGFELLSLGGWRFLVGPTPVNPFLCLGWFLCAHGVGWFCLHQAADALARNWHDEEHAQSRAPEITAQWLTIETSREPASWLTDPRPWDPDPVRWLVGRLGSPDGMIWLALGLDLLAQLGVLGGVFGGHAGTKETWGIVSFVGLTVIVIASGLLAWVGGRFFQNVQRTRDLELLVTTPLGGRNIVKGQWAELRRALKGPLVVLLVLALPTGIALTMGTSTRRAADTWFFLEPFLIVVNLGVEMLALCWVGMWFGLKAPSLLGATFRTVMLVVVFPLTLVLGIAWSWTGLRQLVTGLTSDYGVMPGVIPGLLFSILKNFAFILWAWFRLRRELHTERSRQMPLPVAWDSRRVLCRQPCH